MTDFGKEFCQVWPDIKTKPQLTDFEKRLLRKSSNCQKADGSDIDLYKLKRVSSNFPIEFGTNTCRIYGQPKNRYKLIEQQVASAYPVMHERVLWLYLKFLEHKSKYSNELEKEIYANLSLTDFVQRLLTKRCVAFFGKNDKYQLLSKERGCSGFMTVGTEAELPPLLIKNVLSYDEIKDQPQYDNVLLIVSYAWDGNALPGNEFWMKMLDASGDPSTACSTLITEIHNPHINSKMVCGDNLHIASPKYGVIHISEYSKNILNIK